MNSRYSKSFQSQWMAQQARPAPIRSQLFKLWSALLLVALLATPLLSLASFAAPQPALRAERALLQMAAGQPDKLVGVIVQKTATARSVEAQVANLGGRSPATLPSSMASVRTFRRVRSLRLLRQRGCSGSRWMGQWRAPARLSVTTSITGGASLALSPAWSPWQLASRG